MKDLIRKTLLTSFSLFLVAKFYPGLLIPQELSGLLWSGFIIMILNQLLKPIIKLFLLPLNLLTFGLFSWLANVVVLLFATKIVPALSINSFVFESVAYSGFVIPSLAITGFISLVLTSFFLSLLYNLLDKTLCG
jgi:putative membrane protein